MSTEEILHGCTKHRDRNILLWRSMVDHDLTNSSRLNIAKDLECIDCKKELGYYTCFQERSRHWFDSNRRIGRLVDCSL